MAPFNNRLNHIILHNQSNTEKFGTPRRGGGGPRFPTRDNPDQHADFLLGKLAAIRAQIVNEPDGTLNESHLILEFEGEDTYDLAAKSLEFQRSGIELLTVFKRGEKIVATVLVPKNKLEYFIKKIEKYKSDRTESGKRRNRNLVESISDIHLAILQSLWTDSLPFPISQTKVWWEVWIRQTNTGLESFRGYCREKELLVDEKVLSFIDRQVVLVFASVDELLDVMLKTTLIAELRAPKVTPAEFLALNNHEQRQWVEELVRLITPPNINNPTVCILDTGTTIGHPLIQLAMANTDLHTCHPSNGPEDIKGHGTWMTGLALYGDLTDALLAQQKINLTHGIESVKILPDTGANRPELYGAIVQEALDRVEITSPERKRVVCMAITATDDRDRGQPSSWSAAIDELCYGIDENPKRILLISAGNADRANILQYPDSNLTDGIHDPGQSWNALTVGAFTNKTLITERSFENWEAIAPAGNLCPTSTTSTLWEGKWPIKPDVVFEGGNAAANPPRDTADFPESLSLLTTYHRINEKLLTTIGDTSAATAQAARMGAMIQAKYSNIWPETVRGLIVHSANWTPQMRGRYSEPQNRTHKENILRFNGYGVPRLEKALWSASNSLTLIAQDELQPFDGKKMKEMNLHQIPWPKAQLLELGDNPVEMRVTLSYFIQPNPARRGWVSKHRYQSHGLRFDVKTSTESLPEFRLRLNRIVREEEGVEGASTSSDSDRWEFGSKIRSKGSVHSDYWNGTGTELAEREFIGVYPVVGWWRERISSPMVARYSLIVSINTPQVEIDIYTPVANLIGITT